MATITTIETGDALEPTSRENINDNFSALNSDKLEESDIIENEAVGTGDGVTVAFTLDNAPSPASSAKIYIQGVRQILTDDYTVSGTTLTFTVAPPDTGKITADYRK